MQRAGECLRIAIFMSRSSPKVDNAVALPWAARLDDCHEGNRPMNGSPAILGLAAMLALTGGAEARLATGPSAPAEAKASGIQLAQAREVEVYIDQYGREVLVDIETGEIVAVGRPRGGGFVDPEFRRRSRTQELRGDYGEQRVPLGELLRRELETHLGLDDPYDDPTYDGRDYRRRQRELYPREGYPLSRFPDAPVLPAPEEPGFRYPDENGIAGRAPIEREPLGEPEYPAGDGLLPPSQDASLTPPDDDQLASVPEDGALPETETKPQGSPQKAVILPLSGATEEVAKIQVLLDREGLSPGVIDGRMGDNVNKAISAWRDKKGGPLRTYDKASVEEALAASGGDAFTTYTITPVDAAGPYVASVPEDYGEKAKLERLGYTSVAEMLAERFHMDEAYLKALNPGVNFDRPGTIIKVVNVGQPLKEEVARIVADKSAKQVRAYTASGRLVAAYPATIGSADTPSPSGTVTVERIAHDPAYTYNPKVNFKQGNNDKVLTIPPGPNGPVGSVWIALSKPTYGIHGTPEPSRIGKTYSHGCVRLTNWDAAELAGMVKPGTVVEFVE